MNQLRLLLRQEAMLSFSYSTTTASECISIAGSSITAIATHNASSYHRPTDRYSSALYLVGALLPLICIILKASNDNGFDARSDAIALFKQGLQMLHDMAPNFSLARHVLERLRRVILTVKQAIKRFHDAESRAGLGTDDGISAGDVSGFLHGADADTLMLQMTGFFAQGSMDGQVEGLGMTLDSESWGGMEEMAYQWMDRAFVGTADAMDLI